jgi:hypothetical protein
VDIVFASAALEALSTDEKRARRELGEQGFRKLRTRLAELAAAANVAALVAGRPYPLSGALDGHLSLRLDGGRRLVLRPALRPPPLAPAGGIAWDAVRQVEITHIEDDHD